MNLEVKSLQDIVHREFVLLAVLTAVTIAAFFATQAAARANADLHRRDAAAWFALAEREQEAGDGGAALDALRRAVAKSPENRQYRLALARALAANGQDDEADRVLAGLRESGPEDPEANLELARLEARRTNVDQSRRYYQSALASLWRSDQHEVRRRVRLELIDFLLTHGQAERALSELLVMTADLPEDPAIQADVGARFLAGGDPRRALDHFSAALGEDPMYEDALAGAGAAAFELGEYAAARRYLAAAPDDDPRTVELRDVTSLVLSGDPLETRLGTAERRRRVQGALDRAAQVLANCLATLDGAGRLDLDALHAEIDTFASELAARSRRDPRDTAEAGLELAYRAEVAAGQACTPATTPLDRAIALIARRHGLDRP